MTNLISHLLFAQFEILTANLDRLHYLAQSDCLAADRQNEGNTRLTLTPSVVLNSIYVITVSD
jgi:hypothetical protein